VIVPALTWIAPIVSVLDANLVPVFVDIDPTTFCMAPAAAEAAVTTRTAAILPVHYHCRMADMDGLKQIARRHGLALLEDCAQAHGAMWRDKAAGTIGDIGAFSMHNDKLLTSGEGGAVVTNRADIHARLQTLRLDGYLWTGTPTATPEGIYEMPDAGPVMGRSCCMSEFQAAVLVDQLALFPKLTRLREANARYLETALAKIPGLLPLRRATQLTRAAYYEFAIRYNPEEFAGKSVDVICAAVGAELGFAVFPEAAPVYRHSLYRPQTRRRYAISPNHSRRIDPNRWSLPRSEQASRNLITFLHPPLIGDRTDMNDIAEAFHKIAQNADKLPN
jgi:dTDP-4-amino-4,6-dideoxygalactose transaminase